MTVLRSLAIAIVATSLVIMAAAGSAQDTARTRGDAWIQRAQTIAMDMQNSSTPSSQRERYLEFLFRVLRTAPNDAIARHAENEIMNAWLTPRSITISILMERVIDLRIIHADDRALDILNYVIKLRPKYAIAHHLRAEVLLQLGVMNGAIPDLASALTNDPRCYPAIVALGGMLVAVGDYKRALEAYRLAFSIDPRFPLLAKNIQDLSRVVEGIRI